jgi:hypothetical protein
MKIRTAIFCLTILIFASSCRKDSDFSDIVDKEYPAEVFISTSVKGTVKNERGIPVSGAVITIGEVFKLTDFNGYFSFENVYARKSGELIKAEKSGFQTAWKTIYPQENSTIYVDFEMTVLSSPLIFGSNDLEKVIKGNDMEISIAGNDFISEGDSYTDILNIYPISLQASDPKFFKRQPGDPVGYDRSFNTMGINSFGIIGLEMFSESGKIVETGKKNSIQLKISAEGPDLPDDLSVWRFDFDKKKWLETSYDAKLVSQSGSNYYIAEVDRSGIYNFATKFSVYKKELSIVAANGAYAQYQNIKIKSENLNYELSYRTSDSGKAIAYLPVDEKSHISFSFNQIPYVYAIQQGLEPVTIPDAQSINIKGRFFDCTGKPLTDGYVTIITNSDTVFYDIGDSGYFTCDVLAASDESRIYWVASDKKNEVNTEMHSMSKAESVDLDEVYICSGDFAIAEFDDEYFKLELQLVEIIANIMTLVFSDGERMFELAVIPFTGESVYDLHKNEFTFTFGYNLSASNRLFPGTPFLLNIPEYSDSGRLRGVIKGKARKNFGDDQEHKDLKIVFSARLK